MAMTGPHFSTFVRTDTTAMVRAYPWTNGIALAENRRVFLEAELKGTRHPTAVVDMALVRSLSLHTVHSYHHYTCIISVWHPR
jgi:hypothetical protein